MQTFLTLEEVTDRSDVAKSFKIQKDSDKLDDDCGAISLRGATARWTPDLQEPTLQDISIEINKTSLTAIVGPVGCGKVRFILFCPALLNAILFLTLYFLQSSLLQALLGELPFSEGKVSVSGRISYASQESWVFAASVRQNITFGLPFNRIRYAEVVRVCALSQDFNQWTDGDRTIVGERGTSLSGGQKARINLAR